MPIVNLDSSASVVAVVEVHIIGISAGVSIGVRSPSELFQNRIETLAVGDSARLTFGGRVWTIAVSSEPEPIATADPK